jgi:hypothetical protein
LKLEKPKFYPACTNSEKAQVLLIGTIRMTRRAAGGDRTDGAAAAAASKITIFCIEDSDHGGQRRAPLAWRPARKPPEAARQPERENSADRNSIKFNSNDHRAAGVI